LVVWNARHVNEVKIRLKDTKFPSKMYMATRKRDRVFLEIEHAATQQMAIVASK
jgi:hypothetical protein